MHPVKAAREIQDHLQNYIRRTLPVERSLPELRGPVDALFENHPLAAQPYLELMPSYARGDTLAAMAAAGVIRPMTAAIFAKALTDDNDADPANVTLYRHQTQAVTAVRADNNLVVCSGTGSGKTECFLIPLIDHLVRLYEAGQLADGVQAMILYPMNALVNDQIRRLRRILRHAPFITFGKFTGELDPIGTEDEIDRPTDATLAALTAADAGTPWSGAGFDDEAPLSQEVTTRTGWYAAPAHILVTNYAMLERLLLQPQSSVLFKNQWKYIVLDEAHCYDGSLGTEIAWLVRRLKRRLGNPEALRFMATSATLIDDPRLTDAEKAERIRTDFASRLFPAAADSFAVQFGHLSPFAPPEPAHAWPAAAPAETYAALTEATVDPADAAAIRTPLAAFPLLLPADETGLLPLTQALLGAERWHKSLGDAARVAAGAYLPIAAGDALYLLRQVDANLEVGLLTVPDRDAVRGGFLDAASLPALKALVKFVTELVGNRNDRNAWRELMHDHASPRPSDIATDDDVNGRRRIGNRLSLLKQWTAVHGGVLDTLTIEGLLFLLKIATNLAVAVEQEHGITPAAPMAMTLRLSAAAAGQIEQFMARRQEAGAQLATTRAALTRAWKARLGALAGVDCPAELTIESAASWFLGNDPRLSTLLTHLQTALQPQAGAAAADAHPAQLARVATAVMPDVAMPAARSAALVALIDLGLLAVPAQPPGNRRPLVDLRYHQLLRGLREVGVELTTAAGDALAVAGLHPNDTLTVPNEGGERAVFTLGVCRNCGQPFAMGYSDFENIDNALGVVGLSRMKTERRKFLHAVAWKRGTDDADPEPGFPAAADVNVWLNASLGQVRIGTRPPGDGWGRGHWYRHGTDAAPEFIGECPDCGESQTAANNTRFGIVTPYEARGDQIRLVLLDELIRQVDVSPDPMARQHPGDGRKLLAFSDSRKGAAGLALSSQELFAEVTLGLLIPEACRKLAENPLPTELARDLREFAQLRNPDAEPEDLPAIVARMVAARDVTATAVALRWLLSRENCDRLLEMSAENGADLPEHDAAIVRLLQALRRKGRQTLLARGRVKLGSRSRRHAAQNQTPEWNDVVDDMEPAILERLLQELGDCLFTRARMTARDTWPEQEFINRGWPKLVTKGPGQKTLRFATPASTSNFNRIVREILHLPDDNAGYQLAEKRLEELWPLLSQKQGKTASLIAQGAGYALQWEDVALSPGDAAVPEAGIPSHEAYDAYLLTRPIIPVRIEEHTAQISKEKGAAYQRAFAQGLVNILSCSTTFEMGVDLGELNCVFLGNLPPGVSNYRQRAGRAGRRPGAAAYVLSFVTDSAHDRYYFERPEELLFGKVQAPRIYLENKLFRARHLRAEALHRFLKWMAAPVGDATRNSVIGTKPISNEPRPIDRNWELAGHFFAGRMAGRVIIEGQPRTRITGIFQPLVHDLTSWLGAQEAVVQNYVTAIADVPADLDYSVGRDLLWQLQRQEQPQTIPFPLTPDHLQPYRELAGPNQPELKPGNLALTRDDNPMRNEVEQRFRYFYINRGDDRIAGDTGGNGAFDPSPDQRHLLRESTITWLTRNRVLPKYGFPVDVIRLIPDDHDVFGRNVKLERDLKLGLYEYAPDQVVTADKRRFTSAEVLVFAPGQLTQAVVSAEKITLCQTCHEIYRDRPDTAYCPACTVGVLEQKSIVQPDAFAAAPSRAGAGGLKPTPGTPRQVYAGGARDPRPVEGTSLHAAESRSGELQYFNFGPGYKGYGVLTGMPYSLFHNVKTDIAVWLPGGHLFLPGGPLQPLNDAATNRLKNAMTSAMEAIVRAAALELNVNDRDIGGLLYPDQKGGIGIVLFDESSGGGGAVLPLVLSGDPQIDAVRSQAIRDILAKARALCVDCRECNEREPFAAANAALVPVTRETFLAEIADQPGRRVRQSCYGCLRSYRNQRAHETLDRRDAVAVLDALMTAPPPIAVGGNEDPFVDAPGTEIDGPRLPGLPLHRQPRYLIVGVGEAIVAQDFYVVRHAGELRVARLSVGPAGGWRGDPGAVDAGFRSFDIAPTERATIVARVIG